MVAKELRSAFVVHFESHTGHIICTGIQNSPCHQKAQLLLKLGRYWRQSLGCASNGLKWRADFPLGADDRGGLGSPGSI